MTAISNDFDGNGNSDILFTDSSGNYVVWELSSSGTVIGSGTIGNPGTGWTYVGTGDFNGDGKTDILFKGSDGSLKIWEMNGTTVATSAVIAGPGPAWSAVGVGDFDGDGKADILFRNTATNAYETWEMDGASVIGGGVVGTANPAFLYAGIGDFNGDGKSDILFNEGSGYWIGTVNNNTLVSSTPIILAARTDSGYYYQSQMQGLGDFNGDGTTDITDAGTVWEIANHAISNTVPILVAGTNSWDTLYLTLNPTNDASFTYSLVGTGDYNGDGTSDLLIQLSNGTLLAEFLDNGIVIGSATVGQIPSGYTVVSEALQTDYPDLSIVNLATAQITQWQIGPSGQNISETSGQIDTQLTMLLSAVNPTGGTEVLVSEPNGFMGIVSPSSWSIYSATTFHQPDAGWTAIALGDFNGDGNMDILFENAATGVYATWDITSPTDYTHYAVIGGGALGTAVGYTFAAVADLNGDGKADLVFRNNTTGNLFAWFMNDTTIIGGGSIGNPGGTWQVKGSGDFNGDGKQDLLFEDANGKYAIWDMDGTQVIGGGDIGNPGGTWQFAKIVDLNHDGKSVIVFENASGQVASWLMNDTTIIGGGTLGTVSSGSHVI